MSEPVYERVMQDSDGARKAAVKTIAYERSIETTSYASVKKSSKPTYEYRSRQTHNYRPASLRPLPLASILVLTLTLIGILEWALIRFPHRSVLDEARHAANALNGDLAQRSLHSIDDTILLRRALAPSASEPPIVSTTTTTPPITSTPVVVSTSATIPPNSTPGAESGNAFVRSKSVKPTKTPTQQNIIGVIVHSTDSAANKQQSSPTGTGSGNDNNDDDGNNNDNSNENGSSDVNGSTGAVGGTSTGDNNGNGQTGGDTGTAVRTNQGNQASATGSADSPLTSHSPTLASLKNNAASTGSLAESASRYVASTSASINALVNGGGHSRSGNQDVNEDAHTPLGGAGTFASSYLPIITAVLYRMLWNIIWNGFNLVEPFRLLARPEGASAATALFWGYQRNPTLLECITSRKWALGITTLASSLADLLPALASQSVYINTDWPGCPNYNPQTPQNPCPRRVEVLYAVIRSMQALLGVACVTLLWILAFFYYHSTGLTSDPRSMVAVASLIGNESLLHNLNQISGTADAKEMQRQLSHTRYRLASSVTDSGEVRYGIEHSTYRDEDDIVAAANSYSYGPVEGRDGSSTKRKWHSSDWLFDSILIFVLIGTFAVVLAYHLDHQYNDGFNTFFNSGAFGPSFILTLAATLIATLWKRAEVTIMISAPYQRLADGPSAPDSTILFKPTTKPLASTARAIQHRYFVVAAITIVVLLSDLVLNVMMGGVVYQHGQSLRQSLASRWLSIVILGIMILAAISLLISRLRKSQLPRQPDTLGVVMAYLAAGSMPQEFEGIEHLSEDERDQRVRTMGKKYHMLEMQTEKGISLWTVDAVDSDHNATQKPFMDGGSLPS